MAIGKVEARGSCLYPTSICCQDVNAFGAPILKQVGDECSSNSECASNICSDGVPAGVQAPVALPKVCQSDPVTYDPRIYDKMPKLWLVFYYPSKFCSRGWPVVQIASAVTQGVQAVYTCSELTQMKNNPNIDQAVKDQFATACMTSSISAVTGTIGGGASTVSTFATGLSTGTQLALSGVSMVDNIGNLAVSGINANNVCQLYGSHSSECYMVWVMRELLLARQHYLISVWTEYQRLFKSAS